MSLGSIYRNIKSQGLKDVLSPKRWKIYKKSKEQEKDGIKVPFENALSYCEQVVYRKSTCSDCLKAGECKKCHCLTPHIFFVEEATCSLDNWQEMLSPKDWNKFKEDRKLEIGIKI